MSTHDSSSPYNAQRLLWAGFMAILAAGLGFAIRGGIFDNWTKEFNFTDTQVGKIGGAGLTGFCFGIIIGGVIVDKIGYGKLVIMALLGHILSAIVTFGATTPENAYNWLFWGMFIFAYANGTLEAVANPLVATIFPHNRTHYLNLLHASWPAGLMLGAFIGWLLDDKMGLHWKYQMALYLIPTAIYALMFLGQRFPKSEAAAKGSSFAEMYRPIGILGSLVACSLLALFFADILKALAEAYPDIFKSLPDPAIIGYVIGGVLLVAVTIATKGSFGSIILCVLFLTHALVGAVELGTDNWISNITGNLFTSEQGKYLLFWTSAIMFSLRFCAHWIERNLKLSPIGLLLVCAVLACIGLNLASMKQSFAMAFIAFGIYAVGKTFFWPTMLAIVGDRYPQTGAVAMSIMGGIGMLSAGLIGTPGLGYCKDKFAGAELTRVSPELFETNKAEKSSKFLNLESTQVVSLDKQKLDEARKIDMDKRTEDQKALVEASQAGDRHTLRADSFIPATMAVIYLLLLIYFASIGGYRPLSVDEQT